MSNSEWIMVLAVLVGPIAAVIITLWHQGRKQKREQKITLLRHLLAFRQLPADANFSHAINMIPIEFADNIGVLKAHREFIQSAYATGDDDEALSQTRGIKQTRLIYEMARSLGFDIRETDLQTEAYTATGFVERDLLMLDGHRAWRDIANLLFVQARQAEGQQLSDDELQFLRISKQEKPKVGKKK